jgi:folate-binding protein YgfZ
LRGSAQASQSTPNLERSILIPILRAAGAELTRTEPVVLLAQGEVQDEYHAALEHAAVFDQTDRGQVEVRGEEAARFLHRLLANDVRSLLPGQGNRNLLLSSKGKVRFTVDLSVESGRILLSTEPGRAPGLMEALEVYHFAEQLTLFDKTSQHAPIALVGPQAPGIAARVSGRDPPSSEVPRHAFVDGSLATPAGPVPVRVTALPVAGSPGLRLDAGPEHAPLLWRALLDAGATPAGLIAFDCLRVEAGAAAPRVDVDESIYPQEARLEAAYSLDKGCYIGQEVVAKIDTYGGLNKRLVALRVSNDEPVPRGTRLLREEDGEWRDLGVVTSWTHSFALDTGLVLGFVKRRHQAAGTSFRVGDTSATATIVPCPVRAGALPPSGEFE